MKLPVFNLLAEKVADLTLPSKIFCQPDTSLLPQSIRIFLANQRRSHAKVKDRGEVAGTTKKMWSQKGTGRARHGSAKAGIFVGGGSVHGPQGNQNFSLKTNKKFRSLALSAALSTFASEKCLAIAKGLSAIDGKTKTAVKFLTALQTDHQNLAKSRKIGIITARPSPAVKRAFGNLDKVTIMNLSSLHPYRLLQQEFLILTASAVNNLAKKVKK